MNSITLNFQVYPLVVGQFDKYTFSGWEEEGGTIQLTATVQSEDYHESDIEWISDNPQVAVVDRNGLVRAMTTGVTDVRALLPDGSSAACRIQVIDNNGRFTPVKVCLNTNRLILGHLEGARLHPVFFPTDYFENGMLDKNFIWTSSNPEVVLVNHRGWLFGRKCGSATITGVSRDVGRTVACEVSVIKKSKAEMFQDPLEDMDGGKVSMNVWSTCTLSLPEEGKGQEVCWCSENEGIVSVDQNGNVSAYRAGDTTVYGTFVRGGYKVIYPIHVEALPEHAVTELHLNMYEKNVAVGNQFNLYGIVYPATVLEKKLVWESSDSSVVKIVRQHINLSGLDEVIVEGVEPGDAVIMGRCQGKEVQCKINVYKEEQPITSIDLGKDFSLECGQVYVMEPVYNKNATKKEVLWLSDCSERITVDREGTLQGYEKGTANIYCIAADAVNQEEKHRFHELAECRNIEEDEEKKRILEELLRKLCYAQCKVTIKEDFSCLSNLHAAQESITSESVSLLWNWKSQMDEESFQEYVIYQNHEERARTNRISYTMGDLEPETSYEFAVAAMDARGAEIARQTVTVVTKPKPVVCIDVTKEPYCAVGNGIATDTYAIQKAIDDCPKDGEVLLPQGYIFHSGALFLKSHMTLRVDGILVGSQDPEDYPPVVCRWEGYRKMRLTEENQKNTIPVFDENVYSYSSLINVGVYDEGEPGKLAPYHTECVQICGKGMINGNGFNLAYTEGPCWYIYRKGLPVPQSPKRDQNVRGRVIALYNTRYAYISDVTVAYGPSWTIHPVFCSDVTFDNVKVISMGNGRTGVMEGMLTLNGDGIDPDSSIHVNIMGCYFTVGDDAVAIKSGRNRQGNELDKPSAYIRVTDCTCVDAKGSFCIGSEQSGGAHDILFQNLYVRNLKNFGLWIKSAPCRGGLVENIVFRDCVLQETGGAMQIEYNHGGDENPALEFPTTRYVSFENIHVCGRNKFGIRLIGIPKSKLQSIKLRGFRFEEFEAYKDRKFYMEHCEDVQLVDFTLPDGYNWEIPE